MMEALVLDQKDISDIEALLLDEHGRLKLLSKSVYDSIDFLDRRLFCHFHALYFLPTVELINQLQPLITGYRPIEIGAGAGNLGRFLNIPMTDAMIQRKPEIAAYYKMIGQPTINYPQEVDHLEAMDAVRRYHPWTVVASWVTQLYKTKADILIGHEKIHGTKRILKTHRFTTIDPQWVVSRGEASGNRIWIFEDENE